MGCGQGGNDNTVGRACQKSGMDSTECKRDCSRYEEFPRIQRLMAARCSRTLPATSKTAPPKYAGLAVPHSTLGGYTAATSQRIPLRWQHSWRELGNCCFSSVATRWSLSQNCTTRVSETRDCTIPLGLAQSVANTGSQTIRTRTGTKGFCWSIASIAEDPRKQYGQVGDTRSSKRVRSPASLNTCLNWSRLPGVSDVRGGWPGGVREDPQ